MDIFKLSKCLKDNFVLSLNTFGSWKFETELCRGCLSWIDDLTQAFQQPVKSRMPSIANVGGSITSALALTLLAWAVRFVRSARTKRCAHRPVHSEQVPVRRGKHRAALTPVAVQQLVGAQASSQDKPHTSHE